MISGGVIQESFSNGLLSMSSNLWNRDMCTTQVMAIFDHQYRKYEEINALATGSILDNGHVFAGGVTMDVVWTCTGHHVVDGDHVLVICRLLVTFIEGLCINRNHQIVADT